MLANQKLTVYYVYIDDYIPKSPSKNGRRKKIDLRGLKSVQADRVWEINVNKITELIV